MFRLLTCFSLSSCTIWNYFVWVIIWVTTFRVHSSKYFGHSPHLCTYAWSSRLTGLASQWEHIIQQVMVHYFNRQEEKKKRVFLCVSLSLVCWESIKAESTCGRVGGRFNWGEVCGTVKTTMGKWKCLKNEALTRRSSLSQLGMRHVPTLSESQWDLY